MRWFLELFDSPRHLDNMMGLLIIVALTLLVGGGLKVLQDRFGGSNADS